jgi:hypothetical protein
MYIIVQKNLQYLLAILCKRFQYVLYKIAAIMNSILYIVAVYKQQPVLENM